MATAAEHSGRYRARRHDDEIVPWSRLPGGTALIRRFRARHGNLHDRRHVDFSEGRRKKVSIERKLLAKIRQHLS